MHFLAQSILCCVGAIALWSLLQSKLDSWRISAPLAIAVLGAVIGVFVRPEIAEVLNYEATEQVAELILAALLFSDAIAVRGKVLGSSPSVSLRLLLIALPLGLVLTAGIAWAILPDYGLGVALLLACIVMPIDMAPAASILTDNRLSRRVRSALNVESGYNDGIVAPVFVFALAVVTATGVDSVSTSIGKALSASAISLAVGVVVGVAYGKLSTVATARGWAGQTATSIGVLTVPLMTFSVAILVGGNGFVAAFVAGVAVHACLRSNTERHAELTKQVVEVTSLALWFVFGVVAAYVVLLGLDWHIVAVSALALTLARALPVLGSLVGSRLGRRERLALSALGPRGITTIVLGLLAFNAIRDDTDIVVLEAMIVTVSLSLVVHGMGAAPITGLLQRFRASTVTSHA